MEKVKNTSWTVCQECKGRGKKTGRISKKTQFSYQVALEQFKKNTTEYTEPIKPKAQLFECSQCSGSGLISSTNFPITNTEIFPNVAIIGGGIGGIALAIACLHRGIPFTLYERDANFEARSQGYGLTLQQASKAIKGLGVFSLEKGIISTKHIVHNTEGKVIGEWGIRKWLASDTKKTPKRTNIHISRQALRLALLEQLGGNECVKWNHQLTDFKEDENKNIILNFNVNGEIKTVKTDLLVGADGIRSSVRKFILGKNDTPLHYLDCMVILGICPLSALKDVSSDLLDSATVFQTANGNERIYMMPYDAQSVMWQLSFPIDEEAAKILSKKGTQALKGKACEITQWHFPIPQIVMATLETQISGYPVYDRETLQPEVLKNVGNVTLIGDAAHPMSPFKGQGANQALLDALALARAISKGCTSLSNWKLIGLRKTVLTDFEAEMITRSSIKVKGSADAAQFLHSKNVLYEGDETRGKSLK